MPRGRIRPDEQAEPGYALARLSDMGYGTFACVSFWRQARPVSRLIP